MITTKEGYIAVTKMIYGDDICWATEDDNGDDIPDVYSTKEEVWKEIADSMIQELQQFITGERELEHTDFEPQHFVAHYQQLVDGTIVVSDDEGNPIIKTTLDEWRKNR